jgi:NADH:ubiquinone oxidoreductase subunit 3 (subunit A)
MLNFVFCFFVLALSGFIFRTLWRLTITPVNRNFYLSNTATNAKQIIWLLFQIYVVFGWAAICQTIARAFTSRPSVRFPWPYYILAFFGCGAPLYDRTPGSSNTIFYFSAISFILFSIFPSLTLPWRWFLQFMPHI